MDSVPAELALALFGVCVLAVERLVASTDVSGLANKPAEPAYAGKGVGVGHIDRAFELVPDLDEADLEEAGQGEGRLASHAAHAGDT